MYSIQFKVHEYNITLIMKYMKVMKIMLPTQMMMINGIPEYAERKYLDRENGATSTEHSSSELRVIVMLIGSTPIFSTLQCNAYLTIYIDQLNLSPYNP